VSKYKLTGKKEEEKKPEIPTSYPKMSPLDAATIHVMITESVIFPSKPLEGASMENPPPAILNFVLFVDMLTTCIVCI
jgi:hypothetical protein